MEKVLLLKIFGFVENIYPNTQPPLLRHQSPMGDGAQCDDAGLGNTTLSQPGNATAARAKARITGVLEEHYGNLI